MTLTRTRTFKYIQVQDYGIRICWKTTVHGPYFSVYERISPYTIVYDRACLTWALLLKMNESYINDLIAAEDREKSLRNQLAQLKDSNQKQNKIIEQLKTSGEQSKQTLTTELGTLTTELGTLTLSSRCEPPVNHGSF